MRTFDDLDWQPAVDRRHEPHDEFDPLNGGPANRKRYWVIDADALAHDVGLSGTKRAKMILEGGDDVGLSPFRIILLKSSSISAADRSGRSR